MTALRTAGVSMLGYVHTTYGSRSIDEVKADIDQWASLFDVHGIFVDEVSSTANDLPYYEELTAYINAKTWSASRLSRKACLNFGVSPAGAYYNSSPLMSAVLVVSESDKTAWDVWISPPAVMREESDRFAALVHGANALSLEAIISNAITRNIGHIYVTDRTLAENPWNGLPTFWAALVEALAQ